MKYWKLLRHKWLYLVVVICFIIFIYQGAITHFLTFNTKATDFGQFDGEMIKRELIFDGLKLELALFNFSFYTSFIMPVFIVVLGYSYLTVKEKNIKFNIGKNVDYRKELRLFKWQLASIPVVVYNTVYFILILVSYVIGRTDIAIFRQIFFKPSFLQPFVSSQFGYLFVVGMGLSLAIFCNALFYFKILDCVRHFLRGGILYLLFIWLGSLLLYRVLPYFLVPMTTLMFNAYGNWTILTLVAPYILYGLGYWAMSRYAYET